VREFQSDLLVFCFVVVDCRVRDRLMQDIGIGIDQIVHVDSRDAMSRISNHKRL
jgi:hypothetical protein